MIRANILSLGKFMPKQVSITNLDSKIKARVLSFFDSKTLVQTLPLVSKEWKQTIDGEAELKDTAVTRLKVNHYILKKIPGFEQETPDSFPLKKLSGGCTNMAIKIDTSKGSYVARLAGNNSDNFISREYEEKNLQIAAKAQINPMPRFFNAKNGAALTDFIEPAKPISNESLQKQPAYVVKIVKVLKKLHASKPAFANEFNIFEVINNFNNIIQKANIPLPKELLNLEPSITKIEESFKEFKFETVNCHNDCYPANFLEDVNNKVWLIDWELSGRNDAMFDLAVLSQFGKFTSHQDAILLASYFNSIKFKYTHPDEYQRFVLYKPVLEYFAALYILVQISNKNSSLDNKEFESLLYRNIGFCEQALKNDEFKQCLIKNSIKLAPR